MAGPALTDEPGLPWADYQEDRHFRWLSLTLLLAFVSLGLLLNSITLPEVEQKNLADISPRLAKLILQKKKKKPPLQKVIPKKEVHKKKAADKVKEATKKKQKPSKKKPESAREVAKKSGLIALSDELADLRESFNLGEVAKLPQQTGGSKATRLASSSDLLSASAGKFSGGIQTDTLNRTIKQSELSQRQTTSVTSNIDTVQKKATKTGSQKKVSNRRGEDEIERVFQRNKGAIFNLYNRALRANPSLAGKVVVEMTIAPNGTVTRVKIVSSELDDKKLERKLILKIKKFKFANANVAEIIVTYPIDFLPS